MCKHVYIYRYVIMVCSPISTCDVVGCAAVETLKGFCTRAPWHLLLVTMIDACNPRTYMSTSHHLGWGEFGGTPWHLYQARHVTLRMWVLDQWSLLQVLSDYNDRLPTILEHISTSHHLGWGFGGWWWWWWGWGWGEGSRFGTQANDGVWLQ